MNEAACWLGNRGKSGGGFAFTLVLHELCVGLPPESSPAIRIRRPSIPVTRRRYKSYLVDSLWLDKRFLKNCTSSMTKNSDKNGVLDRRRVELLHAIRNEAGTEVVLKRVTALRGVIIGVVKKHHVRHYPFQSFEQNPEWRAVLARWGGFAWGQPRVSGLSPLTFVGDIPRQRPQNYQSDLVWGIPRVRPTWSNAQRNAWKPTQP